MDKELYQEDLTKLDHLPKELRKLVRHMSGLLGDIIEEYEGKRFYTKVEKHRVNLKKLRGRTGTRYLLALRSVLKKYSKEDQLKLAHSFSLLLELINVCESAFRTWRLRSTSEEEFQGEQQELHFVLTAHPTEARSKNVTTLLTKLTYLLVDGIQNHFIFRDHEIRNLIRMLWQYPLMKRRKATVLSEAEYIYSILFSDQIIDFLLREKDNYRLRISTWVGGDKDGHPGVNDKVMLQCLNKSRSCFIDLIKRKLLIIERDLKALKDAGQNRSSQIAKIGKLIKQLDDLSVIKTSDGRRVKAWYKKFTSFTLASKHIIRYHHEALLIHRVMKLFPGLVVPIQLRENSDEIHQANEDTKAPILLMLKTLCNISNGASASAYVHGFIISHCMGVEDINAALKLSQMARINLPIIPLFEDKESITAGDQIISDWLSLKKNQRIVKKSWGGVFEIMLGYSDSAKQVGALASRVLIRNAMIAIERKVAKYHIKPLFFHGSGGSVDRGGGSISEQVAWWPDSAIVLPKMTIQGEMVQRTFATSEILHSHCMHLSDEFLSREVADLAVKQSPVFRKFVEKTELQYENFVNNSGLINDCLDATPYHFLHKLQIGSRPTKRKSSKPLLQDLRAIPWVLCWTQTRILMPTWWGIGSTWRALSNKDRQELIRLFKVDDFFSSFVKTLSFTLAKVELAVWHDYLVAAHGSTSQRLYKRFVNEYKDTCDFVFNVSESNQLVHHRMWLQESIRLRSPYVTMLNMLQIIAMQDNNEELLKETLVGIACGMLTTG